MKYLFLCIMLFVVLSFAADQDGSAKVFICTGEYAYAYHKHAKCRGLKQCRAEIKQLTIAQAKELKREKPCGYCSKKREIVACH
jgi:hypothetical protein